MTTVDTGEDLLVGLDARAEADPARERCKQRVVHRLVLATIVAVQIAWSAAFAYVAYLFIF